MENRNEIGDLLFGGAFSFINSLADSLAGDVTILRVPKVAMLQEHMYTYITCTYFLES